MATSGGPGGAAAHQVAMGLFYATLPFGDALSTRRRPTCQPCAPRRAGGCSCGGSARSAPPPGRDVRPRRTAARAAGAGASSRRTRRSRLAACLLPLAATCSLAFNVASVSEGVLLVARKFRTVTLLYAAAPLITGGVLLGLRGAGGAAGGWLHALPAGGAVAAWLGFAAFHVARLAVFSARLRAVASFGGRGAAGKTDTAPAVPALK